MADGGTQYDLKLGIDTGPAKRDLDDLAARLIHLGEAADRVTAKSSNAAAASNRYSGAARSAAAASSAAASSSNNFAAANNRADVSLGKIVKNLLAAGAAWLSLSTGIAAAQNLVGTLTSYETTLIGVTKTTGLAGADLRTFYTDIQRLSETTVPLATKDLLDIGAAAGSLGVTGKQNVERYSESIGKLSAASEDLKGAEAATLLTRMMNVQGEGPENVDRLASVIVRLGLSSAATEREITLVGTEVAKATAAFKLGTTISAAYGAALAEMGVQAELGGSAIGRTIREIQSAVTTGGKQLQAFAKVAGVSADEFAKAFKADPNQGFLMFLRGLATYGKDAGVVLERLGLSGDELGKVLPTLATNYGKLAEKISLANQEAKGGTALNEKAGVVFNSATSDLQRFENAWDGLKYAIADAAAPALRDVTSDLTEFTAASKDGAKALGEDLGEAVRQAGKVVLFLAQNLDALKAALLAFLLLKAVVWFTGFVGAVTRAINSLRLYIGTTVAADGVTGKFGATVQRTSLILDQYGKNVVVTEAASKGATGAGSAFLSTAITPLAIGLTALLAVLLLVNDKIVEFSRRTQAEMEAMVQSTNEFGAAIAKLREDTRAALDDGAKAQEVQKRLLEQGIKPGRSPKDDEAAARVQEQVNADYQKRRVGLLYEQRTALEENQKALVGYRSELDQLKQKEKELNDQIAIAQAKQAQGRGQGRGAGVAAAGIAGEQIEKSQAELGRVRERMTEVQNAANMTSAKVNVLEKSTRDLTTATEGYTPPAEKAGRTLDGLGGKADKTAERFAKLDLQLDSATRGNQEIARAYGESTAAGIKAEAQAEKNARVLQVAGDFEGAYKTKIEERVEAQIESEREAVGSKTIAGLKDQVEAAERLAKAYASGVGPEIEQAQRDQALLAAKLANTTGAADKQAGTIEDWTTRLFKLNQQNAFQEQARQMREANAALAEAAEHWDGTAISIENTNNVLQINNEISQATIGHTLEEAAAIAALIRERTRLNALFEARLRVGRQEEEVRRLKELVEVKRSDFQTERQYQQALRATNTEHEVRSSLITLQFNRMQALSALKREDFKSEEEYAAAVAKMNAEFDNLAVRTEAAVRAQAKLNQQLDDNDRTLLTTTQQWGKFADALDSNLSGVGDKFQGITSGLAGVIRGLIEATEAIDTFGQAKGWASAIQAAYSIAQATGLLNRNTTAGGFGGTGEGNYSQTGSQIGAVIGTIIGAYYGGAAGASVGASIGSAAGGILGSFIKKGAEESLATIELQLGELTTKVTKNEGALGHVLQDLGNRINDALFKILDQLGGSIDALPKISLKVRDGVISVWVGAVNARVKEMDQAITFAITEILKQADISGISDTIRKVLENTKATDLDQLARDLDFGRWYERLGLADAGAAFLDQLADFRSKMRQAQDLGLDTAPIGQWLAQQLQGQRNQLLGIQVDPEEQLRQNVQAFNAQIQLTRAEQEARKSDLLVKKAELEAKIAILKAELGLDDAHLHARAAMVDAEGQLVDSEFQILAGMIDALKAVDDALAQVDLILQALPDIINDEELQAALDRLRGGKGGGAGGGTNPVQDLRNMVADAQRQRQLDAMSEFGRKMAEINKKWDDAIKAVGLHNNALAEAKKRHDEAVKAAKGNAEAIKKADEAYARQTKHIRESQAAIDAANKEREEELRLLREQTVKDLYGKIKDYEKDPNLGNTPQGQLQQIRDEAQGLRQEFLDTAKELGFGADRINAGLARIAAAEQKRVAALTEGVIDGLGLPMEQVRDRMKNLGDTVSFLKDRLADGTISGERFGQVMGELSQQAQGELLQMGLNLLEAIGYDEKSEEWIKTKAALEEANFDLQVAQMQFLFAQYVAMGLIAGEAKDRIEALLGIITDPKNRPDFSDPARYQRSSGSSSSSGDDPFTALRKDLAAQIKEWRAVRLGPFTKEATDLRAKLDDLIQRSRQLGMATGELEAAFAVAAADLKTRALAELATVPDVVASARELRDKLADVDAAFLAVGASAADMAQLAQAKADAVEAFVSETLRDYERLGKNPLTLELGDIVQHFDEIRQAFQELGVGADGMARLEAARIAALEDFWKRATEGLRNFLDELRKNDPRVSSQARFTDAQSNFRDLLSRARAGDLDALQQLEAAARSYQEQAQAFLGGGVGAQAVLDEIVNALDDLTGTNPLLEPDNPIVNGIDQTNALLASIQATLAAQAPAAAAAAAAAVAARPDSSAAAARSSAADSAAARADRSGSASHLGASVGASSPPIANIPYEGNGEVVLALRGMVEQQRKRDEEETKERRRRATQATAENAQREEMLELLVALKTEVAGLRADMKKQPPAGR